MTVINMLSFGKEGVAVADEQSSTPNRKYNVAQKLRMLDNGVVYGGSGPSDILSSIYSEILKVINEAKQGRANLPLGELFTNAEQASSDYFIRFKDRFLRKNYGLGFQEFLAGRLESGLPIHDSSRERISQTLSGLDQDLAHGFLIGGIEEKGFKIYMETSQYPGVISSRPYASIGSGSEESERVISGYVESLSREQRESIPREEGLAKVIEATNASSRLNVGVGGAPSIVYIREGEVIIPDEARCIKATEIVTGLTSGLLTKDFSYQALSDLIYGKKNPLIIEEEMKNNAKDWNKLDRIFRGYKE